MRRQIKRTTKRWKRARKRLRRWRRAAREAKRPPPTGAPEQRPLERHTLAIGAIFRDETPYMREWLEYHLLVGVDHFYLYDDSSGDDFQSLLAPYVSEGVVTLHGWETSPGQVGCYNACLAAYRDHTHWLAFIDLDEYLVPVRHDTVVECLAAYADPYADPPAVALNWVMFSTSGHITKPNGLVLENFTRCQTRGNRHVKVVVRPDRTKRMNTPHGAHFVGAALAVNGRGEPTRHGKVEPPSIDPLRVNHYWTKSVEEWFTHKLRRGAISGNAPLRDAEGLLMAERSYNDGDDEVVKRFLPELRARLDRRAG